MTALTLPAQVVLRPVTGDDHEFLVGLYASTRADLALLPLDEEQRDDLVRMQFHAQDLHYRQTSPNGSFDLVEIDGKPVGRLYVDRTVGDIRIIDVSLLPSLRAAGIGSALIRAVQDEAAATDRTVSLHVAMGNRAEVLYERLGFRLSADLGVYRLLEWRAP
ncbi:GNAT family N-acetyltransferase [Nocardioides bizhenqiangii]|uniref:GNAT family N-acetyltransferase n=1 Tax=Nocardioides bizhenqiangii TaxID=3095076 RepID=A0ABZ0ZWA0_9ACTN|nr:MULTISPECIES: GNAT family N-acetyltransferase [unclassified Nocardioides]MDZ5623247.1 GNAT family N-acetyltransferase [Nocardioides sp. HM23]WQQ28219.1 GNAT family N-acetyltransferase [Nocardioides sp. HM61]